MNPTSLDITWPKALAFALLFRCLANAEVIEVGNSPEAITALKRISAGDTLVFANGLYDLGIVRLTSQGTAAKQISIRAKNQSRAVITGKTSFVFDKAAFITLQGFDFETADVGPVMIKGSHHIRVTRCVLRVRESQLEPGALIRWIHITGATEGDTKKLTLNSHHNRIDHNLIEGKRVRGQGVAIDGATHPVPASSQHDRIDHNHFRNFGPRVPNGMEPIRAGLSELSISSGFTLIEDNLFEDCDGDSEVISVKNSDSTVRNNTLANCQGGIYLRHGNRGEISGNAIYGQNRPGSVGVRMWGDDHRIHGNYLQDIDEAGIEVQNGDIDYPANVDATRDNHILVLHLRPRRIEITNNTLVNCARPFLLGGSEPNWDFNLPAQGVRIETNRVLGGRHPLVTMFKEVPDVKWMGNIMWTGSHTKLGIPATAEEIKIEEPEIKPIRWLTGGDVGPLSGGD
jgi:poly(beta-D-mannuronate) lyase